MGKGEYGENVYILLHCWRRSRVRREKSIVLRPKSRPLHTLSTYLRGWKVFCKIFSAGKKSFFPRELNKAGSMSGQVGYSWSGGMSAYLIFEVPVLLNSQSGSVFRRQVPNIWQNTVVLWNKISQCDTGFLLEQSLRCANIWKFIRG